MQSKLDRLTVENRNLRSTASSPPQYNTEQNSPHFPFSSGASDLPGNSSQRPYDARPSQNSRQWSAQGHRESSGFDDKQERERSERSRHSPPFGQRNSESRSSPGFNSSSWGQRGTDNTDSISQRQGRQGSDSGRRFDSWSSQSSPPGREGQKPGEWDSPDVLDIFVQ